MHQKSAGHSARVATADLSGRSSVSSDEKDQDRGINVSVLEEYLYARMHPGRTLYLDQLTQYNSRGGLVTWLQWMPRLIDIRV